MLVLEPIRSPEPGTATDECGNVATCVQTITVEDMTPPTITCPADVTLECPGDTTTVNTGVATGSDDCGSVTITYSDSETPGACPGAYTVSRTWTATDECGNVATCVQTITVEDMTPPTITCPADVTLECPGDTTTGNTGVATGSDDCGSVTITYSDSETPGACPGAYTVSRTWTATDECGNVATCVQTITVEDMTPPTITCPADVTLECPGDTTTGNTGVATGSDDCGSVTITYSDSETPGACPGAYTVSRTWTATDECGNVATCVQTITVEDMTPPTITCPADVTLECPGDTTTGNTGVATGSDDCGSVTITYSDSETPGACPGAYTVSRTWTATDECGNVATCVQTITVEDMTPPTITCPADVTLECPGDTTTGNTGVATGSDDCGSVTITYSDSETPGACPGAYTVSRTWTATDECGNVATCVQTITVEDMTPPTITCPADVTLECPGDTTTGNTGVATGSDDCGSVTITYSDSETPGACPGAYTVSRTWTATDECGNVATCVQTITVEDMTPPTITCPADVTLECPGDTTTGNTGVATGSDDCGSVTITYSDSETPGACPGAYTVSRTWTATDECGNVATCVQTITVEDMTPPTITCPADVTLECPGDTTTVNTGVATGSDDCGSVTITYSDSETPGACPGAYTVSRTWTATDECGNVATCVQTITVEDMTPPTITCPADVTLECPGDTTTGNTGVATGSDDCGSVTITYSDSETPGACPGAYTVSRTWTATDECGNVATCVQTITVEDMTPPTITCPADVTLECPGDTTTGNTGVATGSDDCGSVTITYSDSETPGACPGAYTVSRTWTATDECGNVATCVQTITVEDMTPPTITCPADVTLECPGDTTTGILG